MAKMYIFRRRKTGFSCINREKSAPRKPEKSATQALKAAQKTVFC